MQKSKCKIIFIGTSEFGAIILDKLAKNDFKPILVITTPDKPVGRKQVLTPSPVKVMAQKRKIPVEQPDKIRNLKLEIRNLKPDLGIVAAYGNLIPKDILDIPKYGFINVHPSLLPKYRGPSPIQTAILNGDKETGVSIILMDEKMDHGPILAQRELKFSIFPLGSRWDPTGSQRDNFSTRIPLGSYGIPEGQFSNKSQTSNSKITYKELHNKLAKLGTELLIKTIPKWIKGEIKPIPQDESKATYTKILKKEDGRLDWRKTAEEIERQIRAFDPWPGSFTFWPVLKDTLIRVKILKAGVFKYPNGKKYPIGKVLVVPQNEIAVQCGKDFLVAEKLQLEGGKIMGSEEFLRGHPDFIGTILK